MIFALVKSNKVVNIALVDDPDVVMHLERTYSWVVDITDLTPRPSIGWSYVDGVFAPPVVVSDSLPVLIQKKIEYYQSVAPKLLTELYVQNTLSGITTAQSDEMFEEFDDVLTRIKEGAFPTALYRLSQKSPAGYVTQALIDAWRAKIMGYLG